MSDEAKKSVNPHLIFLGLPEHWEANPPLASSLQHLESALFLIALERYPHALVSCVAAIESAIKAKFKIPPDAEEKLVDLLKRTKGRFPQHVGFSDDQVAQMRRKRNEISHYGFSPNDDEVSARLLLNVAFNFADQCYRSFFRYHAIRHASESLGHLCPDVPLLLGYTLQTWKRNKSPKGDLVARSYLKVLGHAVRWSTQHWSLSIAQQEILDKAANSWGEFDAVRSVVERIKRDLSDPIGNFDCPVCGNPDCLWCELDGGDCFDLGELKSNRSVCAHCGLFVPGEAGPLIDALLSKQYVEHRESICKEYGVILKT